MRLRPRGFLRIAIELASAHTHDAYAHMHPDVVIDTADAGDTLGLTRAWPAMRAVEMWATTRTSGGPRVWHISGDGQTVTLLAGHTTAGSADGVGSDARFDVSLLGSASVSVVLDWLSRAIEAVMIGQGREPPPRSN